MTLPCPPSLSSSGPLAEVALTLEYQLRRDELERINRLDMKRQERQQRRQQRQQEREAEEQRHRESVAVSVLCIAVGPAWPYAPTSLRILCTRCHRCAGGPDAETVLGASPAAGRHIRPDLIGARKPARQRVSRRWCHHGFACWRMAAACRDGSCQPTAAVISTAIVALGPIRFGLLDGRDVAPANAKQRRRAHLAATIVPGHDGFRHPNDDRCCHCL